MSLDWNPTEESSQLAILEVRIDFQLEKAHLLLLFSSVVQSSLAFHGFDI